MGHGQTGMVQDGREKRATRSTHCCQHIAAAIERADEYCADTEPIGGADSVANGNADIRSYTCAKPHANGASLR